MIGGILPQWVAWAEAFDDPPDATLFPEEEALLARAVDRRRHEFTTARHCARKALALLGVAPAPILPGWRGAPQWPPAIVGSITHCAAYRAAAVAHAASVASIGIDAEPHRPLPNGVLATIARPTEGAELRQLRLRHPEPIGTACCSAPRRLPTRRGRHSPSGRSVSRRPRSPSIPTTTRSPPRSSYPVPTSTAGS
jgi:4'-phosphopantetheinyl transferase EntD